MNDLWPTKSHSLSCLLHREILKSSLNSAGWEHRAYGAAVARFHCAYDGDKDFLKADEMLQTALINFPGVLLPLLDKCSIEAEDKVARHSFFVDAQRGQVII